MQRSIELSSHEQEYIYLIRTNNYLVIVLGTVVIYYVSLLKSSDDLVVCVYAL